MWHQFYYDYLDCQFVSEDDLDKLNRDFVLSIHSSDFIISDEVDTTHPRFKYAIADTLIQLAVDKGTKSQVKGHCHSWSDFFSNRGFVQVDCASR